MIEMEPDLQEEIPPEMKLFRAVLSLAFEDAMNTNATRVSAVLKSKAHDWFINCVQDFNLICNLAGYDPAFIKFNYKKLLKSGKVYFEAKEIKYIKSYWKFFKKNDSRR